MTFRLVVVGDRPWLMAQHIASKAAVSPARAQSLADLMDQRGGNFGRTQALLAAGMSTSALNAFLVRFGFNNPDARYVKPHGQRQE